jgi:hypothetical protein
MKAATLLIVFCLNASVLSDDGYTLESEARGARATQPSRYPNRVEIYVTGRNTGVDRQSTVESLRKLQPIRVLSERKGIFDVLHGLRARPGKWRKGKLTIREGITYHLLVSTPRDGTVAHIRVLHAGKSENSPAEVYMDIRNGFGYLNDDIGAILKE